MPEYSSGRMTGVLQALENAVVTKPYGSLRFTVNVSLSTTDRGLSSLMNSLSNPAWAEMPPSQRPIEATISAASTVSPLWNFRPSRRWKV